MNQEPTRAPGPASKTNLILAIVLVLVCGVAYWFETHKKGEMRRTEEAKTRLLNLDGAEELESLKIIDREKELAVDMRCRANCRLDQPNADWEITSPIAFKADEANIGTFVSGLVGAQVIDTLPLEGDPDSRLQEFGLGKTRREERKVELKLKKEATPHVFYVGDSAAVGENVYLYFVPAGGKADSVKIIPSQVRVNMQRSLSYWRAKKLFDFAASEVVGLKLRNPKSTVELFREGAAWYLRPGKCVADPEAVDTFVTGLVFLNAQEFLSDSKEKDRAKFGIPRSRPHYELTVKVDKKPDLKLEIYDFMRDKEPKLYAVFDDRPYIVQLERVHAEKFAKNEDSFRLRNLLTSAEKQELASVSVKFSGKDGFALKNAGGKWSLASGTIEKFSPDAFDLALTKVGAVRILEFMGKKPLPNDTPELSRWKFEDKAGRAIREFTIYGSLARGEYFAMLPSGELTRLERGNGAAVASKIADFEAGALSQQLPASAPPVHAPHK